MDEVRRTHRKGLDPGRPSGDLKVAIVHDYLVNRGGAEKVTLALHRMFPDAPIFTALYHPEATFDAFAAADVRPSRLQRRSRDPESFRRFLPAFARAFRSMDLRGFDLVISSSAGFAHHVRPAGACHVVYCHTPPRFLWDETYDRSVAPRWARLLVPAVLAGLRRGDRRAAARAHAYVANSKVTALRIKRVYGLRSVVVHPPIETTRFTTGPTGDHYLAVGRLLPHRRMDLAVEAFTLLGKRLIVVGDGPARAGLEAIAGPTIEFAGAVPDERLEALYAGCRGVVVPGVEDFGIVPLEANAAGRPVIARAAGGALETVLDGRTGVLFDGATPQALADAVLRRESLRFEPAVLRAHAAGFDEAHFAHRLRTVVASIASSCLECARLRRIHVPAPAVAAGEEA